MELKKSATAGTTESGDLSVTIRPNAGKGIQIAINSSVSAIFGDAIEATAREVLAEFGVENADLSIIDKGALDFAIRARLQTAICRAAEIRYDWRKDDPNG